MFVICGGTSTSNLSTDFEHRGLGGAEDPLATIPDATSRRDHRNVISTASATTYNRKTSGADLARRLRRLKRVPTAADAVAALIKGMDDASRRSLDPH